MALHFIILNTMYSQTCIGKTSRMILYTHPMLAFFVYVSNYYGLWKIGEYRNKNENLFEYETSEVA